MFKSPLSNPIGRTVRGWAKLSGITEPSGLRPNVSQHRLESLGRHKSVFVYTKKSSQFRGRHRIRINMSGSGDPMFTPFFPNQEYTDTGTSAVWVAGAFDFPPGLTPSSWTSPTSG